MNDLVVVDICKEGGFMKDYTLTSVITTNGLLPLSGPGNAYYQKGDETYRLQANWIKGKKEGKAILYNSHNQVCAQLNYVDDEINGDCVIRDDKGITRFHGNMVNGEKDGLCEEFDKNRVRTFYGYYEGGEKRSLLVPVSSSFPHLLKEFSRSGVLLTISEYDPLNCRKNGHCFIFENNNVVRCDMMNQGKRQFTYATYTADTMTCFDEEGNKVYEGSYKNDVTSLFCKEGMGCEFDASGTKVYDGLFHNNKRCWKTRHDSTDPSILLIYNIKDCDLLFRAHVNSEGRRDGDCNCYENGKLTHVTWWENGVEKYTRLVFSGDEATEYASDGITVVYVGHVRNNWREGEGTEYRDGVPSYVGQWHNGVPHGEGSLLNEFGDVMCEGEWRWGYLYTTEGWLDYASREVIQVKEPYKLPLWRQRGGEMDQKRAIENLQRSIRVVKMEKRVVNKGEWFQFVLYLAYAMIVLYYFTSMVFSMKITIISMVIELVLSLGFFLLFFCKDMIEEYRTPTPLLVWEWIMMVESIIAAYIALESKYDIMLFGLVLIIPISLTFVVAIEIQFSFGIGLIFVLFSLPPPSIYFFLTPYFKVFLDVLGFSLFGLPYSLTLVSVTLHSFVFRFIPLYSIIVLCLIMIGLDVSVSLCLRILVITGVFILLWLLVYFTTSDSAMKSLDDKQTRKEEVLKRLTSSVVPLPKPISFSQKNCADGETAQSTKEKAIRLCICLL